MGPACDYGIVLVAMFDTALSAPLLSQTRPVAAFAPELICKLPYGNIATWELATDNQTV
jgi:hypothetical protein